MSLMIDAVYERGVFRPLQPVHLEEGQRVSVSVPRPAMSLAEAEAQLAEWRAVYEGLSDADIAEIEANALDRSSFSQPAAEED